jgi:glutamyl-tRNA synthetase
LLAAGRAYRCYCTAEELDARRAAAQAAGQTPRYDRRCRQRTDQPAGQPFTVRFKTPLTGDTLVNDALRGVVTFQNSEIDDLIIVRSDGSPTYNFCVVVDDALMAITDNIRGDDHLANTPKQVLMYEAMGFTTPRFAHVPLILGLDRARLSKRHGATSVLSYRDEGFLPAALNNYLARLGWSAGDQEIFTGEELIEKFSFDHLGASAGVFNPEKLEWVNAQHLKMTPPSAVATLLRPFLAERDWTPPGDDEWLARMAATLLERSKTLVDLLDSGRVLLHRRRHHRPGGRREAPREGERRRAARPARRAGRPPRLDDARHRGRVPGSARPPLAGHGQARPAGARRAHRRHRQPGDL